MYATRFSDDQPAMLAHDNANSDVMSTTDIAFCWKNGNYFNVVNL